MTDYNLPEPSGDPAPTTDMAAVLRQRWYAHPNDLIGGWSVLNVDKPPSRCNFRICEIEVAGFVGRAHAEHVARLHNEWLDRS